MADKKSVSTRVSIVSIAFTVGLSSHSLLANLSQTFWKLLAF